MREQDYPGSEIVFEEVLQPSANYSRYIISYQSEGNTIYALLTVPIGETPPTGWPVIVFNHGYIPPTQYRTTERYVDYVDGFARHGYIVLKSDYRGHGSSEGAPTGGYGTPDYTIDVLNAVASIKRYPDADPNRIGMWGHSMGGHITLRAMVVTDDIKAGVIWAGVVASYPDLIQNWRRDPVGAPTRTPDPTWTGRGRWRTSLMETYGTFEDNPAFWDSISPTSYLADLSGPIQLHHGTADTSVPVEFSQNLFVDLLDAGIPSQIFLYPGDNHNISAGFNEAMQRSIQFFDEVVKAAGTGEGG
jgi:dipeptidyl aminopeptidase/acylaminoacyl peptidase